MIIFAFMGYDTLDGKMKFRWIRSKCLICAYFDGPKKGTCMAFPNGIPEKYIVSYGDSFATEHKEVEDGQVGDYCFKLHE